jgi:hypothetical protein
MMDANIYRVVAIKDFPSRDGTYGVVKILFVFSDTTRTWEQPDRNIFITQRCYITSNYKTEIDNRYKELEPFILTQVNANPSAFEDPNRPPNKSNNIEWRCYGNHNENIESGNFIPVIQAELPEKSYSELKPECEIGEAQYLFIEDQLDIYGPFQIARDETITAIPYEKPLSIGKNHHIIKINKEAASEKNVLMTSEIDERKYSYIASYSLLRDHFKQSWEEIDFINNNSLLKEILNVCKKGEKQKKLRSKTEIIDLQKEIKEAYGKSPQTERLKRALDLLHGAETKIEAQINEFRSIVNEWLPSDKGQEYLTKILNEKNEADNALQKIRDDIDTESKRLSILNLQKDDIEKQVLDLRIQYNSAKTDLHEIEMKKNYIAEEQSRINLGKFDERFKEKELQLQEIENKIQENETSLELICEKIAIANHIAELRKECEYLDQTKNLRKQEAEKFERIIKDSGDAKLNEKIVEHSALLKMLKSGGEEKDHETEIPYRPLHYISLDPSVSGKNLIGALKNKLNDDDREFEELEIVNLLICVQQNLLTILHGAPGSGKTSSAIKLAQALELVNQSNEESDHFLNIAVARGWVSSRDFIGYFNSLKGVYQAARTGFYSFLRAGRDEGSAQGLRLVLLDEANLSPIEHYWSDFIGMCDPEGFSKPIDTGMKGAERLIYPNKNRNLRFIATINNDETTEAISPRLLDRAPLINMDIRHKKINDIWGGINEITIDGSIEFQHLNNLFGIKIRNDDAIDLDELTVANNFIAHITKNDKNFGETVNISNRKKNAMTAYINRAIDYMDEVVAQDYALAQFVVPLIKGEQKGFKSRIEVLIENAEKHRLNRTEELLKGILDKGDAFLNNYSFL